MAEDFLMPVLDVFHFHGQLNFTYDTADTRPLEWLGSEPRMINPIQTVSWPKSLHRSVTVHWKRSYFGCLLFISLKQKDLGKMTLVTCSEHKSWFQSLIFSSLEAELPFSICTYIFQFHHIPCIFQDQVWSIERCQVVQFKENCITNLLEHLSELSESFCWGLMMTDLCQ